MDTLGSRRDPLPISALTSKHVPTVPKLDKSRFIDSYLQGQKSYASTHAKEGLALSSSWDRRDLSPDKNKVNGAAQVQHYGFATPILAPRITKLGKNSSATRLKENNPRTHVPQSLDIKCSKGVSGEVSSIPKAEHSSKKQIINADSDVDRTFHLLERRERRRAKRAILQPDMNNEYDNGKTLIEERNRKSRSKKEADTKVAAGLALLHGFSATNVRKNRLTLQPLPAIGVFNKGKASTKARATNKKRSVKRGHRSNQFSEFDFLNKTRKESTNGIQEQRSLLHFGHESNSSTTSESQDSQTIEKQVLVADEDLPKIQQVGNKVNPKRQQAGNHDDQSHCERTPQEHPSPAKKRRKMAITESEVWDIELEDPEPTTEIASILSKRNVRQEDITLDTRNLRWSGRIAGEVATVDPLPMELSNGATMIAHRKSGVDADDVISSSPSLCPSQSASQGGQGIRSRFNISPTCRERTAVSKYFLHAAREPAKSAEGPSHDSAIVVQGSPGLNGKPRQLGIRGGVLSSEVPDCGAVIPEQRRLETSPSSNSQRIGDLRLLSPPLQGSHHITLTSSTEARLAPNENEEFGADVDKEVGDDHDLYTADVYRDDALFGTAVPTGDDRWLQVGYFGDPDAHLRDAQVEINNPSVGRNYHPYDWQDLDTEMDYQVDMTEVMTPGPYFDDHPEVGADEEGDEYEGPLVPFQYLSTSEEPWPDVVHCNGPCEFDEDRDQTPETIHVGNFVFEDAERRTSRDCEDETYEFASRIHQCASNSVSDFGYDENASMDLTQQFSQGRTLLLGLSGLNADGNFSSGKPSLMSHAEVDVARRLKGHWLPQRL